MLIEKIKGLKLSADLGGTQLLDLQIAGRDENQTKDIFNGVEALLGMAKMGAAMGTAQLQEESPKMATLVSSIVQQLNSKNNGDVVQLTIEKPEGFDETVAEFATVVRSQAELANNMNRLKRVILAVHNYDISMSGLPFSARDGEGKHSWRTRVLPYLEEAALLDDLDMKKNWDDPANEALTKQETIDTYCDGNGKCDIWYVRSANAPEKFADILDGTSNTIMMILKPSDGNWYEPKDLSVDDAVTYWESLKEGDKLIVGFYDGSVRALDKSTTAEEFRSMLEPNDGK
ncbi:MAG: DUF1559 domain-containing protein [Pirellulaceae bacterium]